ncbi:MAG: regulatory protein RecX [Bacteroidia bacterium]|nr:regulatory protein RecX [Bacteroidia bacterium]
MTDSDLLARLYRYCAYQDRCRQEIEEKLAAWDIPQEEVPGILAHLEAEKFLDEKRFTRSFVRGKFFHAGWGRVKIRYELRQKGIPDALSRTVMAEEIPDETYMDTLAALARKKYASLTRDTGITRQQKVIRFLVQRGFEWEKIMIITEDLAQEP